MSPRLRWMGAVVVALGASLSPTPAQAADHKLRFATLAPKNSAWGKLFRAWQKAVTKKTDGKLELEVFYNGVAGAEDGMVSKMKSGQLDGAALTAVGLSRLHRDVLVLQMPGVLDTWELLDKVRADLRPDLEAGFKAEGFQVLGWGDVGLVRMMSRGFAVKAPADLRGRSPAVWRDEPIGPMIFTSIGNVVPVPVAPMEVLPALRAGKINVLSAPSLAAEQLQWVSHLDHIGANVSVCAVGGMVLRSDALEALPGDVRETFLALQAKMSSRQTNRVRKLDAAAFGRLKKKMTLVTLTDAERESWRQLLKATVERLAEGTFKRELVERVVRLSGKS